jgi:hypothetical protein
MSFKNSDKLLCFIFRELVTNDDRSVLVVVKKDISKARRRGFNSIEGGGGCSFRFSSMGSANSSSS